MIGRVLVGVSAVCLSLAALSGCGGPASVAAVVSVRDAESAQPVVGATLVVQSKSRDHPLSIDTILGRTGPAEHRRTTDELGMARITLIEGRLTRISVLPSDRGSRETDSARELAFVNIEPEAPGIEAWDRWLPLVSLRGRPLELKLERTGAR